MSGLSLTRASGKAVDAPKFPSVADQLRQRGVSAQQATELFATCDGEIVSRQIAVFDWIMEHERTSLKNPAGYLVQSIRGGFQPPAGYQTPEQRAAAEKRLRKRKVAEQETKQLKDAERQAVAMEGEHVAAIRSKLTMAEMQQLEQAALKAADAEQQQALSLPAYRTDQQILQRCPMAECCS